MSSPFPKERGNVGIIRDGEEKVTRGSRGPGFVGGERRRLLNHVPCLTIAHTHALRRLMNSHQHLRRFSARVSRWRETRIVTGLTNQNSFTDYAAHPHAWLEVNERLWDGRRVAHGPAMAVIDRRK